MRHDSAFRYDSEEESEYGYQELSHDGKATVHYQHIERTRARDCLSYDVAHVLEPRRFPTSSHGKVATVYPDEGDDQYYQQPHRHSSRHVATVHRAQTTGQRGKSDTVNQHFVSFYFTNIPHDISYVSLRKGFEVWYYGGCLFGPET